MRRNLLAFAFVLSSFAMLNATTVVNMTTPGTLRSSIKALGISPDTVTNLTVTGKINASDFKDMRDSLPVLKIIDLSATQILAYGPGKDHPVPPAIGTVPAEKSFAVNVIPEASFNVTTRRIPLQKIVLPSGITEIQSMAFAHLKSATEIVFSGNQLIKLGNSVFTDLPMLQTIALPASITSMGMQLFTYCNSLSYLTLPEGITTIPSLTFQNCTALDSVFIPVNCHLTSIGSGAFQNTGSLRSMDISSTLVSIDSTAFSNSSATFRVDPANTAFTAIDGVLYNKDASKLIRCSSKISSLVIPSTVKLIGGSAFEFNDIQSVTIPSSVKTIGNHAFGSCLKLTAIDNTNANFTFIDKYAFYKTTSLGNFKCPESLKEIGTYAFNLSGVKSVTFNSSLEIINDNAFYACSNLGEIDLSACTKLSYLGTSSFRSNPSMTNAKLPSQLTDIPEYAFQSSGLMSVVLPSNLKTLGRNAFYFSDFLKSIELPEGFVSMGDFAFDGCTSLVSVTIPSTCTSIGLQAFSRTKARFSISTTNPNYSAVGNVLYNKDKSTLITATKDIKGFFTVPSSVKTIGTYAFYQDSELISLAIPEGVSIGKSAFSSLTGLTALYVEDATPFNLGSNNPFTGMNLAGCVLYVKDQAAKAKYLAATYWKNFEQIEVGTYNKYFGLKDIGYGYTLGLSPNAEYITGLGYSGLYKIRLGKDTLYSRLFDASGGACVNDQGVIGAIFKDSSLMVNTVVGPQPIGSAGIWKDGKWHSLGSGEITISDMGSSVQYGSRINAISNDSKYAFGMSYKYKQHGKLIPFRWTLDSAFNVIDTISYKYPATNIQGARFISCSNDGSVTGGWCIDSKTGMRRAIVWLSPTEYKVLDKNRLGEVSCISSLGKYAAAGIGSKAAYYDFAKDTLIYIDTPGNTTSFSGFTDNKVGVGYREWYDNLGNMVRKAFYWSEKTGYMEFGEFLKRFAPEITISDPELDFNVEKIDVAMDISDDGKTIIGWTGFTPIARWGWVIKLTKDIDVPNRPINLKAVSSLTVHNKVDLKWEIPADTKYSLTGFNIYRNDTLIKTITDKTVRTYSDESSPAGYSNYRMVALYSGSNLSTYSDRANVTVIDNYNVPFAETFDEGLTKNYWINQSPVLNRWSVSSRVGLFSTPCLVFMTSGTSETYSTTSLISKPFDASQLQNVYMTFANRVYCDTYQGKTDTLHMEISYDLEGDNSWSEFKNYPVLQLPTTMTSERLDITSIAQGKIFRLRFRMSGENRKTFTYYMDDLTLTSRIPSGVQDLKAFKFKGLYTKVMWKEPSGSYGMTYSVSNPFQPIGDEGTPFIAANKFDSIDQAAYKDKYLTSLTAFVNKQVAFTTFPTKLNIVVFKGNQMIVNQPVKEGIVSNRWNTFKLENPVLIDGSKDLYFGLNVTQHDNGEMPLTTDNSASPVDGKGNLFSEDEGASWQLLSAYGLIHNWNIIGNVRDAAGETERENDVVGYELFRDGEKMNISFLYNQEYLDADGLDKACYTVKTFYETQGVSNESEQFCIDYTVLVENPVSDLKIYPNPVNDQFQIKNLDEVSTLQIINLAGSVIYERTVAPLESIHVSQIPAGTYLLRLKSDTRVIDHKLIKL